VNFNSLLENEIPPLKRYARSLKRNSADADDLVQDCLLRAIRKSHLWERGTNLRAWLFTIMHNNHVNDVRRVMREGVKVEVEEVAPMLTVSESQSASLQLRDLDRAIVQLSEKQRQALLLVGFEGMSYEEGAAILDVPVGTVRSRLSRAREAVRAFIDGPNDRRLQGDGRTCASPRNARRRRVRSPRAVAGELRAA
jgi:RNA polymerase sigma-70 factor, ECF subfamily